MRHEGVSPNAVYAPLIPHAPCLTPQTPFPMPLSDLTARVSGRPFPRTASLALAALTLLLLTSCGSLEDTGGLVTLTGQVLSAETNNPVAGAFVRVLPYDLLFETNAQGRFTAEVEIDSTMTLTLTVTKEGFSPGTSTILAVADRTIDVAPVRLTPVAGTGQESGIAASIQLFSQSTETIGVRGSGSEETAELVFQVTDSLGRPITVDNSVNVAFGLGANPGGDLFLAPERVRTDNNGKAAVTVSSGTRAGVVQIIAVAVVRTGLSYRSEPVSLTIHGGLPDQQHFSIGPARFNFPGLRAYGLTNPISVIVGDQYANPVRPGTAVYFTTSHGVVEGSVLTNAQGRGTVDLLSANPLPPDGIAVVTATTADRNENPVTGRTPVVFSGIPVVTITPSVARLNQTYQVEVTDQNGNPLVEGTTISVRVEGRQVQAVGNTNVTLDDTAFLGGITYDDVVRGPGVTQFTFRAEADVPAEGNEDTEPAVEAITVTVSGENGTLELVLTSDAAAQSRTPDAVVLHRADGSTTARLEAPVW